MLVVGATGNQGGAVVDHLLAHDVAFDVRGLSRDTTSDAAQAIEARFGFEFATLEEYPRGAGWEDKQGMDSVPGWVTAMS